MSKQQLQELREALSILSSKSAVLEEREALHELKEDREEYKEVNRLPHLLLYNPLPTSFTAC